MKSLFLLFLCTSFLLGCRTIKESTSTIENIHFGTGGGITGELDDNYIDTKGVVFHHDDYIKTLTVEEREKVFFNANHFKSDTINNPSNIYQYINFKDKGVNYSFVWSNKSPIKTELKEWYDQLISYTKTSK